MSPLRTKPVSVDIILSFITYLDFSGTDIWHTVVLSEKNLSQNWLFDRLITHIYWCVYIFSEYKVKSGDNIIRQGDDGDNFYVVESGLYNIYVNTANGNQLVGKCEDSGSFGELALMYNSKFFFQSI